jgi:hypothetical protein
MGNCFMNSISIKDLLGSLDLKILTVQRTVAGSWWNFERVVSPFSRVWLILDGRATVKHHDRVFELRRGCLHLVPEFCRGQSGNAGKHRF